MRVIEVPQFSGSVSITFGSNLPAILTGPKFSSKYLSDTILEIWKKKFLLRIVSMDLYRAFLWYYISCILNYSSRQLKPTKLQIYGFSYGFWSFCYGFLIGTQAYVFSSLVFHHSSPEEIFQQSNGKLFTCCKKNWLAYFCSKFDSLQSNASFNQWWFRPKGLNQLEKPPYKNVGLRWCALYR